MGSIANGSGPEEAGSASSQAEPTDRGNVSGIIFVISGPSGVGKDTIKARLRELQFEIGHCVTATTRPPRDSERHGVHYFFVDDTTFDGMIDSGELIEHAIVHGKYSYGIPIAGLREGMRSGHDVLVTPDVQGAAKLRELYPETVSIFVAPTSLEILKYRLIARGTVGDDLKQRLKTARQELERVKEFDYRVVNVENALDDTVRQVIEIIEQERSRAQPRRVVL